MAFHPSFSVLKSLLLILTISISILGCINGCVERERLALLDFKTSFASFPSSYDKLSSWNSTEEARDCCRWEGIRCDNHTGNVISLKLRSRGLESNHLRPSLIDLRHLKSLDLSSNNLVMRIPNFVGVFSKLDHLDLSESGFFGMIPPQLGNLSNIRSLHLSFNKLSAHNFEWFSHLSSLETLDLSSVNFSQARDWLSVIRGLPSLSDFRCVLCYIPTPADFSHTIPNHFNSSSSLQTLDLSHSTLSSSTLSLFMNSTCNLSNLVMEYLHLQGPFPNIFDHMIYVEGLDISGTHLQTGSVKSIGNLCNLKELDASECSIGKSIADVLQELESCVSDSLESLDLSRNNLTGSIPSMLKFQSLGELMLDHNHLESFAPLQNSTLHFFPASLFKLSISHNTLNGILSNDYFTSLSLLQTLDLTNNPNLTINFSVPPTEVQYLHLSSCNLGQNFPSWLHTLQNIVELDISQSKISGSIPTIFWKNFPTSLRYFNISFNNLHGILPNLVFPFGDQHSTLNLDLSSNAFYGPIPLLFFMANVLHLSKNNFSSFASLPHSNNISFTLPTINPMNKGKDSSTFIYTLDISDNNLSGEIPHWMWFQLSGFNTLNLANNNLSGKVPSSTGYSLDLYVLNLSNNSFSGPLPSLIENCTNIRIVDLRANKFSGVLPSWLSSGLKSLVLLSIQSNNFTGTIPANLCNLGSLHILDLSHNKLSGNIPSCVSNFVAMTHNVNLILEVMLPMGTDGFSMLQIEESEFYRAFIRWKGMNRLFQKNLELYKLIDLSNNNLSGEIPAQLTSLLELDSLDLSGNNFHGSIPYQIGRLKSLEFLNLSYNKLSGPIPMSLSDISFLGTLDLSHNNLSGRIPKGPQLQNFDSTAFSDNPELCDLPLQVKCPGDVDDSAKGLQPSGQDGSDKEDDWVNKQWFYAGLGMGFAFGFLGILATLTWIRMWRYAFFHFATQFGEWILLVVALSNSKICRVFRLK